MTAARNSRRTSASALQYLNTYGRPNPDDEDFYLHLTEEIYRSPDFSDRKNERLCSELRRKDSSLLKAVICQFREADDYITFVSANPAKYRLGNELQTIRLIPVDESLFDDSYIPDDLYTACLSPDEMKECTCIGSSLSYDVKLPLSEQKLSSSMTFYFRDRHSREFSRKLSYDTLKSFIRSSLIDTIISSVSHDESPFSELSVSPEINSEDVYSVYNKSIPESLSNLRNYPEDFVFLPDGTRINLKPSLSRLRRIADSIGLTADDLYCILGFSSISGTRSLIRAFNHCQYFLRGLSSCEEVIILDASSLRFDSRNRQIVSREFIFESADSIFFNEVYEPVVSYLEKSVSDPSRSDAERARLDKALDFFNKKYN